MNPPSDDDVHTFEVSLASLRWASRVALAIAAGALALRFLG